MKQLVDSTAINSIECSSVLFDDNEISVAGNGVSMIVLWERLILPILCSRVADSMLFL